MGNFRIEVNATGGHGCQREKKSGEVVTDCGSASCPDCIARRFVAEIRKSASVSDALLIHWPHNEAIVDNLLTGKRSGNF